MLHFKQYAYKKMIFTRHICKQNFHLTNGFVMVNKEFYYLLTKTIDGLILKFGKSRIDIF